MPGKAKKTKKKKRRKQSRSAPAVDDAIFVVACTECGREHEYESMELFAEADSCPCEACGYDFVIDAQRRWVAVVIAAVYPEIGELLAKGDIAGVRRFMKEKYGK